MKIIYLILLSCFASIRLLAQDINGVVKDVDGAPLGSVVVLLQKNDTTNIAQTVTDDSGNFRISLSSPQDANAYLVFQHLSCEPLVVKLSSFTNGEQITLQEKQQALKEITVSGTRPMVSVKNNMLVYNPQPLVEQYSPASAFELLSKVPSVNAGSNDVSLLGANRLLVVMDGKTVAMDESQVYEQLKSMSVDKVKSIEISYNAPAKYHFNGAVINIKTTMGMKDEMTAFLEGSLRQTSKTSTDDKASVLLTKNKITTLVTAGYARDNDWSNTDYRLFSDNTFLSPYRTRNTTNRSYGDRYRVSADVTYNINADNRVALDYYGIFNHSTTDVNSGIFENSSVINAQSNEYTKETVHTVGVQADLKHNWTIGARYKSYVSPFDQHYSSFLNSNESSSVQSSRQEVDNAKLSLDKTFQVNDATAFSFGLSYQGNKTSTEINDGGDVTQNKQQENIEAAYAQAQFNLFKKLSVTLGLRGEYIKSTNKNIFTGSKYTLWEECDVLPTVTLGLPMAKANYLQFSLSSQKDYPSFWAVSPETTVIDDRTISIGNEALRPSKIYDSQLMFILKQSWFFILGCTYTPDYFANIPHQDASTGKTVYRYENYDYSLFNNLTIMHPLKYKNYQGRIAAHVLRMEDKKKDFYGSSFDNDKWVWAASLNNSYKLPLHNRLGQLVIEANFRYQSPSIQGIYEMSDSYALDADVRWSINKSITCSVDVNNLLCRAKPS